MAGHSKWANIRFRKGAQDVKRGKVFTKLIREITVATQEGGDDLANNPKLRLAMDKANKHNMPKDTVQRAIKRAVGTDSSQLSPLTYEGYGPYGVAIIVTCLTDNRNRTASDVRHAFCKFGGNLGTDGSVSYLFRYAGLITVQSAHDLDTMTEKVLDAGGDDLSTLEDQTYLIETAKDQFMSCCLALKETGIDISESELGWVANELNPISLDQQETVIKLIDALESLDDVENVYTNAQFAD